MPEARRRRQLSSTLGQARVSVTEYRALFDRRVWLLAYGQVVQSAGRGILMPFATLYFYNVHHFPISVIGGAVAIAFPLGGLLGLFWGALADAIGRRPLMLCGSALASVTPLALILVTTKVEYVAVVVLQAVAMSMWNPAARAMIADVTPGAARTRVYGLNYMANNFGLSLGLLVGGVFAALFGYRALFIWDAAGTALCLGVVWLFITESHVPTRRLGPDTALARAFRHVRFGFSELATPLRDRAFLRFALAGTFVGLGWSQFYSTYSAYMKNILRLSDGWIGALIAINTVMVVVFQIPIAHWAERRRRTRVYLAANWLLAWSLLAAWAAYAMPSSGAAIAMMAAGLVIQTTGEIMVAPAGGALMAALAGSRSRFGRYMAALDLSQSVGAGLGATVGGAFFDLGHPLLLWPVMTSAVLVGLIVYRRLEDVLSADVNVPRTTS